MSITGLLIGLIGFAVVALFIAAPLFERARRADSVTDDTIDPAGELTAAYARIKSTLRDLDEDHTLGKLDDDAYRIERERWLTEGAQVLAALDALKQPEN